VRNSYDTPELHRAFTRKCLKTFRFLAAYGCELSSIEQDTYGVEITYKNQTTGIKVSFEVRENDIFVYLIRLINGEIPAYLDAPSRWFYLDNVVKFRSPSTTLPRKGFGEQLTPDDIEHMLAVYADALKEYGEDVLHGDFSVFVELGRQIDRPRPSDNSGEIRLITSNEELNVQRTRLLAQIPEYYDTYFSELRSQLQGPNLFSEAIPAFLRGYKRVVSVGGSDGIVVAHFPAELEITMSETDGENVLMQFLSVPNAKEDTYEFLQFPGSPVKNLATFISGGEDVGLEIPLGEVFWGVRGFNAPQQKIDSTTGELTWQAPWTRLVCADLYHLRYWEDTERARREAREDVEPYVLGSETASMGQQPSVPPFLWVYAPNPEPVTREELNVGGGLFAHAT
jgi:hypothetical protein